MITELFSSIQGEGTRAGAPCAFVRLAGCPLRCVWCDTAYAFYGGRPMSVEAVAGWAHSTGHRLVCVTGGEPLAQPAVFDLISALCERHTVVVETSGHISTDPVDRRAYVILDVKCPQSGMIDMMLWDNVLRLRQRDEAKFVIANRADYEWARDYVSLRCLWDGCTVLFSPVHGQLDPGTLGRWLLDDAIPVRLQVQLHKYLWPGVDRGV
jgi:7-carboxy-7-deazaguanine synthase